MSEQDGNRLSAAYSVAEAERFQGVTLTAEQYAEFTDEARDNLAKIVCERRQWRFAKFYGVEQRKDGTVRVMYRRLDRLDG